MNNIAIESLYGKIFDSSDGNLYEFFTQRIAPSGDRYNTKILIKSQKYRAWTIIRKNDTDAFIVFDVHEYKIKSWLNDENGKLFIETVRWDEVLIIFQEI